MSHAAMGATKLEFQFDDLEQQANASVLGMWVFLLTEVMFFGGMFTGYAVYRYLYLDAFAVGSGRLDLWLGATNTGLLLTSSLTMALGVYAAQHGRRKAIVVWLLVTVLLGMAFLAIKFYEYHHKFETNLVPGTSFQLSNLQNLRVNAANVELFFSFYFAMTGLHAVHMVIGIGLLGVVTVVAWRGRFDENYSHPVENVGLYWHFVDIIWIFLFPLLYLVEA